MTKIIFTTIAAMMPFCCYANADTCMTGLDFEQMDQDYCNEPRVQLEEIWRCNYFYGPVRVDIIKSSMMRITEHLDAILSELELIDWMVGGEHYNNIYLKEKLK